MILHLIEIILLLMVLVKLGVDVSFPSDPWTQIGLVLVALIVIVLDHWFYEPDYNKIRDIIREELENEREKKR